MQYARHWNLARHFSSFAVNTKTLCNKRNTRRYVFSVVRKLERSEVEMYVKNLRQKYSGEFRRSDKRTRMKK